MITRPRSPGAVPAVAVFLSFAWISDAFTTSCSPPAAARFTVHILSRSSKGIEGVLAFQFRQSVPGGSRAARHVQEGHERSVPDWLKGARNVWPLIMGTGFALVFILWRRFRVQSVENTDISSARYSDVTTWNQFRHVSHRGRARQTLGLEFSHGPLATLRCPAQLRSGVSDIAPFSCASTWISPGRPT